MASADPRRLALDILQRVEEGAFSDLALDAVLRRHPDLDSRDRGLLTELVYGCLRHQGRLDVALQAVCDRPLAKLESRVLWLLRLGAYQLLQLDRVPPHAAIGTTVDLAKGLGLARAAGFINGNLRQLQRQQDELPWPGPDQPEARMEQLFSLPGWLAKRWCAELGPAAALELGEVLLQPAPMTLRANTLVTTREVLLAEFAAAGHHVLPTVYAPEGFHLVERGSAPLPGEDRGAWQVQDQASMLMAHLLAPQPGERLLDACAAPGSKATHLCALMDNRGTVVAVDKTAARAQLVRQGAERLGCRGLEVETWDMTRLPPFAAAGSFDRVLVDAPCSGLGVIRRNPESRWRRRPQDVSQLAALQRQIVATAVALLKPGGTLLYAVCTPIVEETTIVVESLLRDHPNLQLEPLQEIVPIPWRELIAADGCLHSWPHRHDDMDAFFAARFRKR